QDPAPLERGNVGTHIRVRGRSRATLTLAAVRIPNYFPLLGAMHDFSRGVDINPRRFLKKPTACFQIDLGVCVSNRGTDASEISVLLDKSVQVIAQCRFHYASATDLATLRVKPANTKRRRDGLQFHDCVTASAVKDVDFCHGSLKLFC